MTRIEFRVLGPLEVWRAGEPVAVRGGKPRALLAMLLLHAGEVVSTDQLIDALWGERPPSAAPNALQAHVAALRRVLEPGRAHGVTGDLLITRSPGYLLAVDGVEFDVPRFESVAAEGHACLAQDPARAAGLLREALALWRGPALADFAYESFAQAEAARLEEMRLAAVE
ncbi:MAG: winged helix-turn-helix domain-containing protein, partial [Solirubrobacterales bacterium]|nr:winged helix-turn-helix domain-containing protein [Solirubrobacterales bacterium]